jgi:hypothetical protein
MAETRRRISVGQDCSFCVSAALHAAICDCAQITGKPEVILQDLICGLEKIKKSGEGPQVPKVSP